MRHLKLTTLTVALLCTQIAQAVNYYGGDGTGQTTAPTDDPGWANVGTRSSASGVYLGDYGGSYWVLTANHVGAGTITLNGISYATTGTSYQLHNDWNTGSESLTDLRLFEINSNPGLPTLTISSSAPTSGNSVTMIGNGTTRATSLTYWDANWNEVATQGQSTYRGYKLTGSNQMRWATNTVDASLVVTVNSLSVHSIYTSFNASNGQGQAAGGDSGGALFYKNGSTWELSGIMVGVYTVSGQPGGTSIAATVPSTSNANFTFAADLSYYRDEIMSIITPVPEPYETAAGMGLIVMAAALLRRRKA
jgi:hypothetical protein